MAYACLCDLIEAYSSDSNNNIYHDYESPFIDMKSMFLFELFESREISKLLNSF